MNLVQRSVEKGGKLAYISVKMALNCSLFKN